MIGGVSAKITRQHLQLLPEKTLMLKRIVYNNFLYQNGNLNELNGYRRWIACVYRILRGTLTRKEATRKKESLVKKISYDEGTLVSCMVEDTPKAEAVPAGVYGDGRLIGFEHMKIIVPTQSETYLKKLYGDYMQLPPEGERIPLHTCVVIDTEKSYLEFTKNQKKEVEIYI